MTDPPRLLDEGADDFELDLLRSAETDAAPTPALSATLSAVAQAGGAIAPAAHAGAATGAAAKGAVAKGATASAGTAVAGTATKALLAKALLVGVIASGLAVGYAARSRPSAESASATGSVGSVATTNEVPPLGGEKPPPAVPAETAPEVKPEPSATPTSSAQVRSTRSTKRPREATAEPSVTEQIISLDRVRAAIAARDGARALRELDRHDREFAGGVFGPEATALRIEAWMVAGDRAKATALAEQFLRTPAGGAHATRIRSLVGSPEASSSANERGVSNP